MRGPAIVLSLLAPGTGQLVLGRRWRGVGFAVLGLLLPLGFAFLGIWGVYAWLALRAVAAIDAGVGVTRPPMRIGAALAGGGQLAGLMLARAFVIESFIIRSASMEPGLRNGDHVFIDKLGGIERGDVVAFDDPCGGSTTWTKRVVALGGDTVELRCGIVYVNGAALPQTFVAPYEYDDRVGDGRAQRIRGARYREAGYEVLEDEQRPGLETARGNAGDRGDYLLYADAHDFPPFANAPSTCPAPRGEIARVTDRPDHPCDPQMHYTVPAGSMFVLGDNRENSIDSRIWGAVPTALVKGRVATRWWRDR